ncbi:glutathione S-transferase family protein [Shewanella sp. Isolate11]|uniref:glutathione S-transferase family protein n=1 Tax=Shewanella sp. Isolate11 TaxID=2908530 RepID=UPI001EFED147|nr:glutathione S-transferase family protein [Shewanella sp. Isolate11]MCG9698104.1 glutathione S-transferase family protein [Shewanella sp. Isolate11]
MELFYHPLCRYSQKVLIALYEKQAHFFPNKIDLSDPFSRQKFAKQYPPGQLPLLRKANGELIPESSIIIEYIDHHLHTGSHLLPTHFESLLEVRLLDRQVDIELNNKLYVIENMHANHGLLPIKIKRIENEINMTLERLNQRLIQNHWLCGDHFTLADCALIPCLMDAKTQFQLYQYDGLDRYLHQAEIRGAWMQVKEEAELAKTASCSLDLY